MVLKVSLLILVIIAAGALFVSLVTENSESVLGSTINTQGSLYVAKFETVALQANVSEGNITLVNPTSNAFNNLNITIKLDGSDLLWYSNYNISWTPNPNQSILPNIFNQTANVNFSPQETINVEPHQTKTFSIFFASSDSFQFSSHKIQFFVSQNSFGDIINGQSLSIPQTMVYLKILGYSQIESDNNTYHEYFNSTLNDNMYTLDNPNFFQRYTNFSIPDFYAENYGLMESMGVLGNTYFNVTVVNNSTFSVTHVTLLGDPSQYPNGICGGPGYYQVMQPNDTLLFPVGQTTIPSNGYVTGYITNASSDIPNLQPALTSTPAVPELTYCTLSIAVIFGTITSIALVFKKVGHPLKPKKQLRLRCLTGIPHTAIYNLCPKPPSDDCKEKKCKGKKG